MHRILKSATVVAATVTVLFGASACTGSTAEFNERKEQQDAVTLEDSLEKANLAEKLERENDPTAVRYVYLYNMGSNVPVGYYVIKGKVSSSGSQLAPEQEVIQPYAGGDRYVVDSAQDDGTYGEGDPGIFFFLADGTMVSTQLIPLESDHPLPIDVPKLGG